MGVNFAKSKWFHPAQEFVGIAIDHSGLHPAERNMVVIVKLTPPCTVAEFRALQGMTGYLRKFVEGYGTVLAPVKDALQNRVFQTNKARKVRIPWEPKHPSVFEQLNA